MRNITKKGSVPFSPLTLVTDPRGLETTYSYDALDNLLQQISPDTGTTTHTYDAAGNLASRTDARGAVTTYTYDALNRVTQISATLGSDTHTTTIQYDTGPHAIGKLTQISDPDSTTGYSYDSLGRLSAKSQTIGGIILTTAYAYDGAGRLSQITYPSGKVISYAYDGQGRISTLSVDGQGVLSTIQYTPFGAAESWNWGNGSPYARTFDADGRINSYTLNGFVRSVDHDNAGRITALNDATSQSFGYDNLDRLTSYTSATASQSFGYDAVGNRTQLNDNGLIDTYSYAATSNRLTAISGGHSKSYSYTAGGNIAGDGTISYSYDPRNRMIAANDELYLINGLGQRIQKQDITAPAHGPGDGNGDDAYTAADRTPILNQILQTGTASGNSDCNQDGQVNVQDLVCLNNQIAAGNTPLSQGKTLFAHDEQGQLIGEYNASGNAIEETVYLGSQPVVVLKQGNVYYIHTDQLNTPRVITDSADTVIWRWDSDPFGTTAANDDPDLDGVAFAYNLRFAGQYYDAETGLHYNYFRDYDPSTGRYVESDPIGLHGGLNTFAYVEQNPVSATDPAGLARLNPGAFPGDLGGGGPFIQIINAPRSHGGANTSAAFVEMAKIVGAIVIPPVAVGVAVASAPIASSVTSGAVCRIAANPETQQTLIDFTTSLFPGTPTMNAAGVAGFAVGSATNPQEFLR